MRHRRPWGRLLTWKGEPPMAVSALSHADCEAVRMIVVVAVAKFNALTEGVFNVDSFGAAVRSAYDLKRFPTPGWCEDVLGALPYVTKVDGYRLWRYTD